MRPRNCLLSILLSIFINNIYGQVVVPAMYKAGDSLIAKREYEKSHDVFIKLISTNLPDSIRAECYLRLGFTSQYKNEIDSAILYFKKSVALFSAQNNRVKTGRAYEGIAKQYNLQKNYTEADTYYKLALQNYNSAKDSVKVYISMVVGYMEQDKIDTAYGIVKKQLEHYPDTIVSYLPYYKYEATGLYLKKEKQFDAAITNLQAALPLTEDERYKASIYVDLSDAYRQKKDYRTALLYMDSAVADVQEDGWAENLQLIYQNYTDIYADMGDYKKAYLYSDSSKKLSDSLFNTEATRSRLDAEAKYKNQQILLDKAEAERQSSISQRNFVVALLGLGFIALIAFVSFRIARVRKKANTILTVQKQQVQQLADDLAIANNTKARLFSTIGHDLRSPVSTLYALLKMQEVNNRTQGNISEHIVQLLDTLEELLTWSKSQMDGFVIQPVKIRIHNMFEELLHFYAPAAKEKNIILINNTEDIVVTTDENILRAIFRNAISNAITNTSPGNQVILYTGNSLSGTSIAVKNLCSKELYDIFKSNFISSGISSNTSGFGIVLMKEFAQKINTQLRLSYENNNAVLALTIPVA